MKDPQKPHGDRPVRPTKRPYRKPRLEIYGELGQITATVGTTGKNDHAKTATNKTS